MAMLIVDGVEIKAPSSLTWGLQDVSDQSAGRTQQALMYKNRIAQKRKIELEWSNPTPEEIYDIVRAFQPEYISVQYHDPLDSPDPEVMSTRVFYTGDKTAPVYSWTVGEERYSSVSFNIIER